MLNKKIVDMPQLIPPPDKVMGILTETGAFRQGHFVYPSGEHTPHYFQMPLALRHYQIARELGVALSRTLRGVQEVSSSLPKITIVSPGSGGIALAFSAQVALAAEMIFWAERENGKRHFRQYVQLKQGAKCVVIDDIVRSGGAFNETAKMIEDMGGKVIGFAALVRFTSAPSEIGGIPIQSLVEFETERYKDAASCPLCKEKLPLEEVWF